MGVCIIGYVSLFLFIAHHVRLINFQYSPLRVEPQGTGSWSPAEQEHSSDRHSLFSGDGTRLGTMSRCAVRSLLQDTKYNVSYLLVIDWHFQFRGLTGRCPGGHKFFRARGHESSFKGNEFGRRSFPTKVLVRRESRLWTSGIREDISLEGIGFARN